MLELVRQALSETRIIFWQSFLESTHDKGKQTTVVCTSWLNQRKEEQFSPLPQQPEYSIVSFKVLTLLLP
jgi:hypothetical protein